MIDKNNSVEELLANGRGVSVADFGFRTMDTLKKDDGTIEVLSYSGYTKKEIDVKKAKTTFIIQIVAFVLWLPFFISSVALENGPKPELVKTAIIITALLINKYPHEFSHYIVNRMLGFKCKIRFGLFTSECKVIGTQSYKQVILSSAAPLLCYVPIGIFVFASNIDLSYKLVWLSVLLICLSTMAGDFQYIYHALTNKEAKFNDYGTVLIVMNEQ